MTGPAFWIPLHPDGQTFARVFLDTVWADALGSRSTWEAFCRDILEVWVRLPPGSGLFVAIHAQVIIMRSLEELIPTLLQ